MRIDLHVHSVYSGDSPLTPREIIKIAKKLGLDAVAITDHNSVRGALAGMRVDKNFVLPGTEIRSRKGDILALGITENIPGGLDPSETVEKIREKGGIAVAAHPYALFRKGLGDLVRKVDLDAVEVFNAHLLSRNKKAMKVCLETGKPMTAGSDAHLGEEIGLAGISAPTSSLSETLELIRKGRIEIFGRSHFFRGILALMRRRMYKVKKWFSASPSEV